MEIDYCKIGVCVTPSLGFTPQRGSELYNTRCRYVGTWRTLTIYRDSRFVATHTPLQFAPWYTWYRVTMRTSAQCFWVLQRVKIERIRAHGAVCSNTTVVARGKTARDRRTRRRCKKEERKNRNANLRINRR